jgi:hypothetical protein
MKIALLIPSTSNGRTWSKIEESYLFQLTLKSFLETYDTEHEYVFYIGIDRGDKIYDNEAEFSKLSSLLFNQPHIRVQRVFMDGVEKGFLTKMWNILFRRAYDEGCNYFFQCGDDIVFKTRGWINDCIRTLERSNDIGMTGPMNNNIRILTQTFVSRKHMEIFGFYFTEQLINWCCDDWINGVYKRINRYYPLTNHFCENLGGSPRYFINNDTFFSSDLKKKHTMLKNKCAALIKMYSESISVPK